MIEQIENSKPNRFSSFTRSLAFTIENKASKEKKRKMYNQHNVISTYQTDYETNKSMVYNMSDCSNTNNNNNFVGFQFNSIGIGNSNNNSTNNTCRANNLFNNQTEKQTYDPHLATDQIQSSQSLKSFYNHYSNHCYFDEHKKYSFDYSLANATYNSSFYSQPSANYSHPSQVLQSDQYMEGQNGLTFNRFKFYENQRQQSQDTMAYLNQNGKEESFGRISTYSSNSSESVGINKVCVKSEPSEATSSNHATIQSKFKVENENSMKSEDSDVSRNGATLRERNRMHILNDAFDELRKLVPKSNLSEHQRLSKIATLRLAIHYISALTRILQNSGGCRPVDPSLVPAPPRRRRRRKVIKNESDEIKTTSAQTKTKKCQ